MYYVQIFTYHVGPFQGWMWVRVVDIPKLEHQIYIYISGHHCTKHGKGQWL